MLKSGLIIQANMVLVIYCLMVQLVFFSMTQQKLFSIPKIYILNIWKGNIMTDKKILANIHLLIIQKNYKKKSLFFNILKTILKLKKNMIFKKMMKIKINL